MKNRIIDALSKNAAKKGYSKAPKIKPRVDKVEKIEPVMKQEKQRDHLSLKFNLIVESKQSTDMASTQKIKRNKSDKKFEKSSFLRYLDRYNIMHRTLSKDMLSLTGTFKISKKIFSKRKDSKMSQKIRIQTP